MQINITARIELWFDGEQYRYQLDLEGDVNLGVEMCEGESKTLSGATGSIGNLIAEHLTDSANLND